MADDIKFVIGVDDTDVLRTIKNSEILEKRVVQLGKEYSKLDDLHNKGKLSIQDYSRATNQLDKEIRELNSTLKKGGAAVNQLASGMNVSGKSARRNEIAFQQAGYQVQDFIVQVQGGTNPLIAFSQQASQLAGFFAGPWGAMIGLGIAAASSLALAFQAVSSKADDAKNKIMSLADAQKGLNEATADYQTKIDMLKFGVDTEEEVRVLQELIAARKEDQRIREAMAATDSLSTRTRLSEELKENRVFLLQLQVDAKSHADKRAEYDALKAEERAANEKKVTDAKNAASMADAERMLGEQMADRARQEALATFNGDLAATEGTLDSIFKSRTLFYSIRFAGEESVMAQGFGGPTKTKMSYAELKAAGVSDANIEGLGVNKPKSPKGSGGSKKDLLGDLQKQLNLEQQLVGKSEEYVRVRQALGDTYDKVEPKTISNLEKQIVLIREATEAENQRQQLMSSVESSLEQGFMSMIDGTKSVKEAFKDMAREIIKELYRVLVVKKMVSTITSFLPFADGGVFSGGSQVQAFANGGVVGGPTMFPMSGGKTGLMGEAGPEAIMPLKRGANGKLGVQMEGGGSVTVVNNFNVAANGDDSVKRIVQQQIPRIAEATKAAVVDSKRRGGSYGRAFG